MAGMVEGQTVLVTGTGSGIGRETALLFAEEGARRIACIDIAEAVNQDTAATLRDLGVEVMALQADLGSVDDIRRIFTTVRDAWGRLDSSLHIGGFSWRGETLDVTEEQWDTVINANLRSTFFCSQEALRTMYPQKSGAVVNISADAAFHPIYGFAVQAAGKGGIVTMSKTLALEAAEHGVRVNVVSPGIVSTQKQGAEKPFQPPLRRLRQVDPEAVTRLGEQTVPGRYLTMREVAQSCLFLCSSRASGINGDLLFVNGGGYFGLDY